MAAERGHLMVVKTLLKYNAKPDFVNLVSVLILISTLIHNTYTYNQIMHLIMTTCVISITVNEQLIVLFSLTFHRNV